MIIDVFGMIMWFGGVFGLWYIIGRSKLTEKARNRMIMWRKGDQSAHGPLYWPVTLIECPACFSTWVALFTIIGSETPADIVKSLGFGPYFGQLLFVALTTASSWFLGAIIDLIISLERLD
jgi:hypothetical protein